MQKEKMEMEEENVITVEVTEDQQETEQVEQVTDVVDELANENEAKRILLEQKEKELFDKEVAFSLSESGLQAFKDVIKVNTSEELQDAVQKLTAIVNDIKIGANYIPKENIKESDYDVAKQNGDTRNMIKSLFGFGR